MEVLVTISLEKNEMDKMNTLRFVQLQNPRTKNYVKIDRKLGLIIGYKKTPYKNIKFIK